MTTPRLIEELYRTAMLAAQTKGYKRLRLAVTQAEYLEVRDYCLKADRVFYGRLADVPLIIDEKPIQDLMVEYGEWTDESGLGVSRG